jgi:hypothetical protein
LENQIGEVNKMAIRPKIKKSAASWETPEFKAEMKAIDEKWAKMSAREKKSFRNSWDRPEREKIKTVPKKVVTAKVKTNKNAPKTTPPKTGNVTVIPKGSKPKTLTNSQKAAAAARRSGRGGRMGGMLGGGSLTSRTK